MPSFNSDLTILLMLCPFLWFFWCFSIKKFVQSKKNMSIKITTMFIEATFKDSKKVTRIRNYVLECNLYLHFLIWQKLLISGEKMLMTAELICHVIYVIVGYMWQILGTWNLFCPTPLLPIREQPQKGTSWIELIDCVNNNTIRKPSRRCS